MRKEIIGELLNLAGVGATGELLSRLEELRLHTREPTWRAKLSDLIEYISNNRDGIENAVRIDFYGSSPVEKASDVTICRRFKKRGMSWYVHKASPYIGIKAFKIEWRVGGLLETEGSSYNMTTLKFCYLLVLTNT